MICLHLGGSYVALTLLGKPPSTGQANSGNGGELTPASRVFSNFVNF